MGDNMGLPSLMMLSCAATNPCIGGTPYPHIQQGGEGGTLLCWWGGGGGQLANQEHPHSELAHLWKSSSLAQVCAHGVGSPIRWFSFGTIGG
jgi:hypothetical protein